MQDPLLGLRRGFREGGAEVGGGVIRGSVISWWLPRGRHPAVPRRWRGWRGQPPGVGPSLVGVAQGHSAGQDAGWTAGARPERPRCWPSGRPIGLRALGKMGAAGQGKMMLGAGAVRRPLWSSRQEMTTPKGDEDDVVILLLVLARFFGVLKQGYFSGRTLTTAVTGRTWCMWPQRGYPCLPFDLQPRWNCHASSSDTCRCRQCHTGCPRVSQPGGSLGPMPGEGAC